MVGTRAPKVFPSTALPELVECLEDAMTGLLSTKSTPATPAAGVSSRSVQEDTASVEGCQRWSGMLFLEVVQRDEEAFKVVNGAGAPMLNYELLNKLVDWRRAAFDISTVGTSENEEHEVEMQMVFEEVDSHLFRWFCRLVLTTSYQFPPSTLDACLLEFGYLGNCCQFFLKDRVPPARQAASAAETQALSTSIVPTVAIPLQVNPLFYARRRVMFLSQQLLGKAVVVTNFSEANFDTLETMLDLYVNPKSFLPFTSQSSQQVDDGDGSSSFDPAAHQQGSYVDYEVAKALVSARLRCLGGTKEERDEKRVTYLKMLGAGGI